MFLLLLVNFAVIQPLPTVETPCIHVQRFDPRCELWSNVQCNGVHDSAPFTYHDDRFGYWKVCTPTCNNTVSWVWDVYCSDVPQAVQSVYIASQNQTDCETLVMWESSQTCHHVHVSFRLEQSAWVISPDPSRLATWYPAHTLYEEAFPVLWNQSLAYSILPTTPNCPPLQRQLWFDTIRCPQDDQSWQVKWSGMRLSVYMAVWCITLFLHFLFLIYHNTEWSVRRLLFFHAMWTMAILVYASMGWAALVISFVECWFGALATLIFWELYSVFVLAAKWRLPSTQRLQGVAAFLCIGLLNFLCFLILSSTRSTDDA